MKRILSTGVFFCLLVPSVVFASGLCCQLSSGVQESISGMTAPETKKMALQLTYSFTFMDKLRQGRGQRTLEEVMDEGRYKSLPTRMEMTKHTLTAGYGFTPKLKAFISVPYIRNTMDMKKLMGTGMAMPEWMDHVMTPVQDIGDITLMGLYRLYTNDDIRPSDTLTVGVGIKTPTGSAAKKTKSGKFVHAHMQPGTGSWDPLFTVIYTRMMNPFLAQADATYQITTRNGEGYEFGDSIALNLSGKYAVSANFNVAAALTYLHTGSASDEEGKYTDLMSLMDDPANTGGKSLWFSPGIQVIPLKNSLVDLKVQLPVWEKVNGIQLVSTYRVLFGVSYRF